MTKRYQRGDQKPLIEEGQTTQWPKDTKRVIRSVNRRRTDNTMTKRKRYQRGNQKPLIEEGQTTQWTKEKGQRINKDLQNITHKTKDRVTWAILKTGGELRCSGRRLANYQLPQPFLQESPGAPSWDLSCPCLSLTTCHLSSHQPPDCLKMTVFCIEGLEPQMIRPFYRETWTICNSRKTTG
jgi:hypothetical protein